MPSNAKFLIIGATRGEDDEKLLQELKQMTIDMQIDNSITFFVNQPRDAILAVFAQTKVAIHTMKEEHFGISIVEMMSAGLVTIAHASGGPLHDIIGSTEEPVGFVASTEQDYVDHVVKSMNNFDNNWFLRLRDNARKHVVDVFGIYSFNSAFLKLIHRGFK